jgi:hypothetical protein
MLKKSVRHACMQDKARRRRGDEYDDDFIAPDEDEEDEEAASSDEEEEVGTYLQSSNCVPDNSYQLADDSSSSHLGACVCRCQWKPTNKCYTWLRSRAAHTREVWTTECSSQHLL